MTEPESKHFPSPRHVETPRGRFAVRVDRRAGPQAPVLVLLHGWPQSSFCWGPVSRQLSGRFQLIMPDLRGLGDSVRSEDATDYLKDQLAADIWPLLDALEIERFGLVGHDWGGAVAQEMLLIRPGVVARLALINTVIINNLEGNASAQAALNARGNRPNWYQHFQQVEGLPEAMIPGNEDAWLRCFLRGLPEHALQEYVRCYRVPGTAASGAGYYRSFPADIKRWKERGRFQQDVDALYLHGQRDKVITSGFLEHGADCFRSLQVQTLEAGHFVPEEQPESVASSLETFFQP